jgi:hypothetical protein
MFQQRSQQSIVKRIPSDIIQQLFGCRNIIPTTFLDAGILCGLADVVNTKTAIYG